jgi:hypothetical protein
LANGNCYKRFMALPLELKVSPFQKVKPFWQPVSVRQLADLTAFKKRKNIKFPTPPKDHHQSSNPSQFSTFNRKVSA